MFLPVVANITGGCYLWHFGNVPDLASTFVHLGSTCACNASRFDGPAHRVELTGFQCSNGYGAANNQNYSIAGYTANVIGLSGTCTVQPYMEYVQYSAVFPYGILDIDRDHVVLACLSGNTSIRPIHRTRERCTARPALARLFSTRGHEVASADDRPGA